MISLVVPVYQNEENIPSLLEALQQLDRDLEGSLEIVFVVEIDLIFIKSPEL